MVEDENKIGGKRKYLSFMTDSVNDKLKPVNSEHEHPFRLTQEVSAYEGRIKSLRRV